MARDKQKLEKFAQALALGKTPVEAAKAAGYPKGSSFATAAHHLSMPVTGKRQEA